MSDFIGLKDSEKRTPSVLNATERLTQVSWLEAHILKLLLYCQQYTNNIDIYTIEATTRGLWVTF